MDKFFTNANLHITLGRYCLIIIVLVSLSSLNLSGQLLVSAPVTEAEQHTKKGDMLMETLDFEAATGFYHKALTVALEQNNTLTIAQIRNKLTESIWRCENIEESEKYAYENLDFCLKNWGWNHAETAVTLENLGAIANYIVPSDIQLTFFTKALEINRNLHGNTHSSVAVDLQWMGWYYEKYVDSVNARKYLFESLAVWKKIRNENHPDIAELYRYIGLFYNRYNVLDSSRYYLNRAKKIFDEKYGESNYNSVKCINNLCRIYEFVGRRDTSIVMYHHALGLIQKIKGYKRNIKVMTYYNMSDNYCIMGQYEKALEYVQHIFSLFLPDFNPKTVFNNPETKWTNYYPYLMHTAHLKVLILYSMGFDSKNSADWDRSVFELNQMIDYLQDQMRLRTFSTDLVMNMENYQLGEGTFMARNALTLYGKTADTNYLTNILNYLSKNRFFLELATPFNDSTLLNFFPAGIIKQRQNYIDTINHLKINARVPNKPNQKSQLPDRISEQRILLSALNIRMAKSNNLFSTILNQKSVIYLGSIQKKLKKDQVMMYFGEASPRITNQYRCLYQIVISPESAVIREIGSYLLSARFLNYRKAITENRPTAQIDSIGYQLYKSIFDEYHQLLVGKELIIIPSTQIASIPMELLPTSDSAKANYFIQENLITYLFSINDFFEKEIHSDFNQNSLLGVVPSFGKTRKMEISLLANRDSSLIDLPGALKECEKISEFFPSEIITGDIATENLFKSRFDFYPIIHLSTHGLSRTQNHFSDELAFSKTHGDEDGYLHFSEILNMKFRTEMIVLSACKTGIGNSFNSVANMSLGWAFKQAGAQSVLISLWDANDYASSAIMPEFYSYLLKGFTRPQALRLAKLNYLEEADNLMKHPVYWAGFQYYGPNEPVNFISKNRLNFTKTIFVVTIIGSLLFIGFLLIKRRETS